MKLQKIKIILILTLFFISGCEGILQQATQSSLSKALKMPTPEENVKTRRDACLKYKENPQEWQKKEHWNRLCDERNYKYNSMAYSFSPIEKFLIWIAK